MALDMDAVERFRNSEEFAAVMECLWRDISDVRAHMKGTRMEGGLEFAAALVLDHWKHGDHLRHMLPLRDAIHGRGPYHGSAAEGNC